MASSDQQLRALMEHGEEMGCINMSAFTALVQELDLDDDELNGLYEQIEERVQLIVVEIELLDERSERRHVDTAHFLAVLHQGTQLLLSAHTCIISCVDCVLTRCR